MSAHGDKKDTCLSPPVQNKMSEHDDESLDETKSYPPTPDDIIYEFKTKPIPSRDDPDMEWDHPSADDIIIELDRPTKTNAECSSSSKPDDKVVNRNSNLPDKNSWFHFFNSCESSSLTVEEFPILGSTSSTELTPNRLSFAESESSSIAPTLDDSLPASTVGSPPDSPSPQVSPTGSATRPTPSSKRPFSDKIIWGNICPLGVDPRTDSGLKSSPKTKVLGSGRSNYGYGSVIDTTSMVFKETVQSGDDEFNKGQYKEALQEYDKAVHMKPEDLYLKIVRAETLVCLYRFEEAFNDFQEAYMLDPDNGRLHDRLSLFHLRLGFINKAHLHMTKASPECKKDLSAKIAKVKDHLISGGKARKDANWIAALREVEAIIAEGVDSSQPILAFRAEMLLRLDKLEQAEETMKRAIALESKLPSLNKFLGMSPEACVCAVNAQIDLALGRFDNAVEAADQAHRIGELNDEISAIQTHVQLICKAKSVKDYEAAIKIYPENERIIEGLQEAQAALDKLQVTELVVAEVEAQVSVRDSQVTKLCETPIEVQDAVKELQATELSETLVEAQEAIKEPQVTELSETLVEALAAVKESQVEDVSED